ncbi:MAG: HD-like signal output (HDOD) protein [Planctomycetota bacterium]|jgi:HD-like signal output (HDOD) protein
MLPGRVVDLSRLDPNAHEFASEVRKIAESDPPLTACVLAAGNSAASAPISEITSVESALTRLGALKVARIVTSLAVMRVFVSAP